jgi:RNA polymerase sigma-70 factor (ECF subfamily)
MSGRAMVEAEDAAQDVHLAQSALSCPTARDALTRRLGPRVFRLVASFVRNDADAEDASQAALIEILRAMPSFRGESRLEAWADRIAVRTAIRLARAWRLASVRRHDAVDPDELPTPSLDDAAEALPRSLLSYLDALPEARRSVLVLRHVLGYSVQEVAELTGVSVNTVKDRLLAARHEVRRMVRRELVTNSDASGRRGKSP